MEGEKTFGLILSLLIGNAKESMNVVPVASYMLTRESMSRERTLANMAELLLGGVDTTANATMWAIYELSRNPQVKSKMYAHTKTRVA